MLLCEIIQRKNNKVLKTQNGSIIKRSTKFGVGKDMGGAVYIHKQYSNVLPQDELNKYKKILNDKFSDFEYNIIKYIKDGITFLNSPDFDTANEPLIVEYVNIKQDGSAKRAKTKTIYHHKWLFVKDDYKGFDVDESFQRSQDWLKIPNINFNNIGSSRDTWINFLKQNEQHLPDTFIFEGVFYTGKPLEVGGTSTNFSSAAPGLKLLVSRGNIKTTDTVIDYGAGKYGRNARYLREQGIKTYAYDPFNGNDVDGWKDTSKTLPSTKFDVGFTSFVLNVVPKHIESSIIKDIESKCKHVYHIVRNYDVFDSTKKALLKKDKIVWNFFIKEFLPSVNKDESVEITDDIIKEFCIFGVQTSKGFQRICYLEDSGYTLIKGNEKSPYKIYGK